MMPSTRSSARLRKAEDEEPIGLKLADHVVVNDDLETTIDEMLRIIAGGTKPPVAFPGCPTPRDAGGPRHGEAWNAPTTR